jgi:hypothetical protein
VRENQLARLHASTFQLGAGYALHRVPFFPGYIGEANSTKKACG